MSSHSIAALLSGQVSLGSAVTVRGWVRTRRDSKAGLSFIGGSQREERLDVLDRRLAELGLSQELYGWYRDLRRYGTVPHAGFGLGFERTVSYVTGMGNVRDVIPFPRTPGNAEF